MQSEAFNIMLRYDLSPAHTHTHTKKKETDKETGLHKRVQEKGIFFSSNKFCTKIVQKDE